MFYSCNYLISNWLYAFVSLSCNLDSLFLSPFLILPIKLYKSWSLYVYTEFIWKLETENPWPIKFSFLLVTLIFYYSSELNNSSYFTNTIACNSLLLLTKLSKHCVIFHSFLNPIETLSTFNAFNILVSSSYCNWEFWSYFNHFLIFVTYVFPRVMS